MIVLAVDTALAACSAALFDSAKDRVLSQRTEPMSRGHAERLATLVDEIMHDAALEYSSIDRIASTTGPGTFTGVRIGLAFARGLAIALNRPVIGISTLEAIACAAQSEAGGRPVAALIDARRGEVYLQVFSASLEPLTPPAIIPISDVRTHLPDGNVLLTGSGAALMDLSCSKFECAESDNLPQPGSVARLAAARQQPSSPPAPLYLRRPDAKPQTPLLDLPRAEISIGPAGPEHAEILAAIHAECFARPWQQGEIAGLLATPGTQAWIAQTGSDTPEPAALIMTRMAAGEAEILTVATRPNIRRRAIAGQLLAHAIAQLAASGCEDLFLEVDEENTAARRLYSNSGFAEAGRRRGYYRHSGGHTSDAILMRRKL